MARSVKAIKDEGGQKVVELDIATVNQDGVQVLSGYAEARIDA